MGVHVSNRRAGAVARRSAFVLLAAAIGAVALKAIDVSVGLVIRL
jgi:hypothetical protein